jgi:hypothetical protein
VLSRKREPARPALACGASRDRVQTAQLDVIRGRARIGDRSPFPLRVLHQRPVEGLLGPEVLMGEPRTGARSGRERCPVSGEPAQATQADDQPAPAGAG